jgi:hypothetical protein
LQVKFIVLIFAVTKSNNNMGTRSMTDVIETYKDDSGKKREIALLTMYRQYDGYPSGMGADLAEFLSSGKVVNGIGMAETERVFNGAGCLAAQLVANFKQGAGGFYIHKPKQRNCGEEYIYQVYVDHSNKEVKLRCLEVGYMSKSGNYIHKTRELFFGDPKDFTAWLEQHEKQHA